MRTPAIGFLKQLLLILQGCTVPTGYFFCFIYFLGYFVCVSSFNDSLHYLTGTKRSKCFDFAINYYPFWTHILITKICAHFTSSILLKNSLVKN
jgi:hypothetical protein